MAAFLRTKIVLHAAKEKIWSPSNTPVFFERYDDIEIEEEMQEGAEAQEAQYVEAETVLENESATEDGSLVF